MKRIEINQKFPLTFKPKTLRFNGPQNKLIAYDKYSILFNDFGTNAIFLNDCLEKIVDIQFSTASLNYICVLAHSQKSPVSEKFDKNMFYIIKVDQIKSMESFSFSEICEQKFEINASEEIQAFNQNTTGFEMLFFGG